MISLPVRRILVLTVAVAVLASGGVAPTAADDPLARTRAAYAGLRSYADAGTLLNESTMGGASLVEKSTFTTAYRAPRHFMFDFKQDPKDGQGRFVIWGDAEAFHTWWATTGVEETYPVGTGAAAFAFGSGVTGGALMMTAPLLFAQAGLVGALSEITEATLAGTELVNGRSCQRLNGVAKSVYGATGHETNVRRVSVWIDADTLLVRKMVSDTPRGTPAGTVMRTTITLDPQPNPSLPDARFKFAVPSPQM